MNWKSINKNYRISDTGIVYSIRYQRFIVAWRNEKGYLKIQLGSGKIHFLHVLVCTAFNGKPRRNQEVHHKNNIRDDNEADNLEWKTHLQNLRCIKYTSNTKTVTYYEG